MVIEEWVEVRGRTVELALQVALEELKLSSPEQAEVEVVQEPQKGFLGLGGRDAIIKVKPKPKKKRRRRRRSRAKGNGDDAPRQDTRPKPKNGGRSRSSGTGSSRGTGSRQGGRGGQERSPRPAKPSKPSQPAEPTEDHMDVESQAQIVKGFLDGLLEAFGLEGDVETRIDDGVIYADVTGEQTEALVGPKGSIMQAIQELTRTVVQRQSRDSARIRLDIAGYGERRRSALKIYTGRLAEQVLESGREAVLEPMNPSDRKVVHDVIAEIEGVRSYSEGEEPNRSVVVGLAPGYEPPGDESTDDATGQDDEATADATDDEEAVEAAAAPDVEDAPDDGDSDEDGDEGSDEDGDEGSDEDGEPDED